MKNRLNIKRYIYIYIYIITIFTAQAQYSTTFNYVDVNTQAFTVPPSFMGNNNLNAYNMSILDMSQRLSAIYSTGAYNVDYNINSLIKVKKVYFSVDSLTMLLVQPIYSPTVSKRCILLTNGNGEKFENWFRSNRYAIDFALRGYIVAYYENSASENPRFNNPSISVSQYFTNKINPTNLPCVAANSPTAASEKFIGAMFNSLFISNAARSYLVANKVALKIDDTKLFIGGGSFGANAALFFAYGINNANTNNYSNNALYACVKSKLNYPEALSNNGIKGVMALAGGLPAPTEQTGNIIDGNDNGIATMFISGAGDPLVNPNISHIFGLETWGVLSYKNIFNNNNINNNIYINCYGTHVFQTPSFNDASWQNNNTPIILKTTLVPQPAQAYNYVLTQAQVSNYINIANTNPTRLNFYQYDHTQGFSAINITTQYFNNIVNNTIPTNGIAYIEPNCIQNPYFQLAKNGTYNITQCGICQAAPTFLLCPFMNFAVAGQGATSLCLDGTYKLYPNQTTGCASMANNFTSQNPTATSRMQFEPNKNNDELKIDIKDYEISTKGNQIVYTIPQKTDNVQLIITDVLGKITQNEFMYNNVETGVYTFPFDNLRLTANGIYICTLIYDGKIKSTKFNYIK